MSSITSLARLGRTGFASPILTNGLRELCSILEISSSMSVPPAPPPLITFHDRTPVWNFGSTTGLLEIDLAMERELGVDRAFWITVALAYLEFLTEREVNILRSSEIAITEVDT